eukprot:CAMPEP_0197857568 /NCGR_PEP_ID=MMETSP1438-20131217/30754_1 /TAXON_ID=1461541 /ORGANISM="Pterosperma sp., Strain CCMP1384" /LENGTH=459 /DNA_ID=CAMNT_0043473445 /DNA_START=131 /DNA_END=1507 /DNA_ORIENTATION=-
MLSSCPALSSPVGSRGSRPSVSYASRVVAQSSVARPVLTGVTTNVSFTKSQRTQRTHSRGEVGLHRLSAKFNISPTLQCRQPLRRTSSQVSALKIAGNADFDSMAASRERQYYMVGGKGGVGKTSLSASLAVKFANSGHATLIVSTDPAHSLSDSLAQDVSGGKPVLVEGTDMPLYGLEVDPDDAKAEFKEMVGQDGGKSIQDGMSEMGLGALYQPIADLKLGELLDTPPPGLDEAVAISKVMELMKDEKFDKFTRVVFDTAPTGHTLRLLSLPEFLEASIGKVVRLRQKLSSATSAIKGVFGVQGEQDEAVAKLESLKARVAAVRELFRDPTKTEFVIATIPTVMAANESARLLKELTSEDIACRRIVVNQLMPPLDTPDSTIPKEVMEQLGAIDAEHQTHIKSYARFCESKRKDQARALVLMDEDPGLHSLNRIESPMFDLEIRGVPALQFFGSRVW